MKYILKYSHSAFSHSSFFSVIKSCEGTQQGDPESPALFSDSIQNLIDSLESKTNLQYLDDGNLSDDYRTVLNDLKKIVEEETTLGLNIKPTKCGSFSLGDITEKHCSTILASFQKLCPKSKHQRKMNLSFLVHRSAQNHKQTYWRRKLMNW